MDDSSPAAGESPGRPLVSVLIPTYARPHFLRQAIASVLGQTYTRFELLVGDDGAQGGEVVAAFGDDRVRYLKNARRLGMAQNWQALLDAAQGEILGLLMDDDRWAPDFLESCVDVLVADPEVGVVFTNHSFDD